MIRAALVLLLGMGSCASSSQSPAPIQPLGTDVPIPLAPVIRGEGVEVRHVRGQANIEDVHRALIAASGRRVTNEALQAAGYEVHAVDLQVIDAVSRSFLPTSMPNIGWLGMPVIWRQLAGNERGQLLVRTWPMLTELGPRIVVELIAQQPEENAVVRTEYLLPPGDGLIVAPSRGRWPEQGLGRPQTVGTQVLTWTEPDAEVTTGSLIVLLLPRLGE